MSVSERISTGLPQLDRILSGGLIKQSTYLIRGGPGQGKTTLGLHFLAAAEREGPSLFIGFQESEARLRANAESVGIDVSNIKFLNLVPDEHFFTDRKSSDAPPTMNSKQEPLTESITNIVDHVKPTRVFVDSMTQLRFFSTDVYQYRKQVFSLLHYFQDRNTTVLLASECNVELPDDDLQFISDGVITLDAAPAGSFLQVSKFRGSDFLRGPHQMRLGKQGLQVFPRLLPPEANPGKGEHWRWGTGVEKLDAILHGGLEAGTISLLTGPSGVGKSTLASLFVAQAAAKGRKAAIYLFEEDIHSLLHRSASLKINLKDPLEDGRIMIEQVEPLRYLTDEFIQIVRQTVEKDRVELVVLDSIAGFELTLSESSDTKRAIHTFAKSLSRMGVSVILVNEAETLTGQFKISENGIGYLADNIIFLRFVEAKGELKKSLGVLKKRLSPVERRMFLYHIGTTALYISDPVGIQGLQGVLAGIQEPLPEYPWNSRHC